MNPHPSAKLSQAGRASIQLIHKYVELEECLRDIEIAFSLMKRGFARGNKMLVCGNGGSAADSEHIVGELVKGMRRKRPISQYLKSELGKRFSEDGTNLANSLQEGLPVLSLNSQTALISAISNDMNEGLIFAQQVNSYGNCGDVLLCISTSGNSRNILNALKVGKVKGMVTIGLTGKSGGQMEPFCDALIRVPYESTSEVQERHLPIYHALCSMLEDEFFPC